MGVAVMAAVVLWCSEAAMQAARTAARVFASGVLPALFPMMVLGRLAPMPGRGWLWQTAVFSFLSGSPASAQRAAALQDAGVVPARVWESLLCLTGVMSPMFFAGTLAQWTGNAQNAWRMLFVHWAGAALAALAWRLIPPGPAPREFPKQQAQRCTLPRAIEQSCRALLSVCGAMMLFAIASAVVQKGLGAAFPGWTQAHGKELAVLWALLEIGGGARAVIDAFPAPPWALLCALCSCGGVSILLQNLLFVGEKIRPARLAAMRLLHGAISFALFSLLF